MRPTGSAQELEAWRMVAARLFDAGKSPTEVANLLGVTPTTARRWKRAYTHLGKDGLRAKRHPGGSKSRLRPADRERLAELLLEGACKHGFSTEVWTLPRVAVVIERHFGIRYSQAQVWRILRSMGWSCQKPQKRAREQNPDEVAHWRRVEWPRIKKLPRHRTAHRLHRRDRADAPASGAAHLGTGRPDADPELFATP